MKTYNYTCQDCGKEYLSARSRPEGRRRCAECAMKRMVDASVQLYEKSGPYYERWVKGMKRAARAL